MVNIIFHSGNGSGQTASVPSGTTLQEAAGLAGIDLRTHCGGAGTCKKCVVIVNGKTVLACRTKAESDLTVVVPESSLRKNEQQAVVQTGLTENFSGYAGLSSPFPVLRPAARSAHPCGIAVDIGTTTLAAELHDFAGQRAVQTAARANPQRAFGDDLMTRIQKGMENPAAFAEMQQSVVHTVNEMIAEMTGKSGLKPDDVSAAVVAGNTVMQCLFFGIDPSPLGEAPYIAPAATFPPVLCRSIGLAGSPDSTVEGFPVFGGFVGGDITAGVLTLQNITRGLQTDPGQGLCRPCFFLDIGTNGEMVLAKDGGLFTAATAAGPAFEGAKIRCGTLAVPGAVDHVTLDGSGFRISTIGNLPAVGLCGSGLIDAVAVLLESGVIKSSGQFAEKQKSVELVSAAESGTHEPVVLTQQDIRELQLAAGAMRAGMTLLLQKNNVQPEELETFYVAGGFGQFIRPASARRIGLLPPLPLRKFQFCGNTSLAGAGMMLRDPSQAEVVRRFVQQSQHFDLASFPEFHTAFAESMRF
ncbi:MAG: ASKHA domain-containing protein [Planctomycetaceae bacterium]|nr:ASKHA domain-containing protein [Planctomycetaceae bacterium]